MFLVSSPDGILLGADNKPDEVKIIDHARMGEMTVAMAQALIQNALDASSTNRTALRTKLGLSTSGLSRILSGDRKLSVRTLGEILACCGFEVRFKLASPATESASQNPLNDGVQL